MNAGNFSAKLLVVDDDSAIVAIVERFATQLGFTVDYRSSGRQALADFRTLKPDVALVDLQMPGLNGLDVLRALRAADADCQVILMTGQGTIDTAIEAIQAGAVDYLAKPFDFDRLRRLLGRVKEGMHRQEELLRADSTTAQQSGFQGMIGRSVEMQRLFRSIERLAPHVRTVLVTGETGTGKELVAKALHASGRRADRRFLTLNCAAVVETLFESELFGHVRGAFTGASENKIGMFEHAHGGTLFLDEIGELPLSLQPKLLRAVENGDIQRVGSLESRRVDVCVVAATNRDLLTESGAGRFRSDLYHRFNVIQIHLPPLRSRREDIPYLTAAFVREFAATLERPISGVAPAAEQLLQQAPWPGNIRELRNVIERACLMCDGRLLTEPDIVEALSSGGRSVSPPVAVPQMSAPMLEEGMDLDLLSTAQRDHIQRVMQEANGNKAVAAKQLGISRRSLYRWLKRLNVSM